MSDKTVSLAEAKAHLSELTEWVAAGEDVIITKHGKAVAWLSRPGGAAPAGGTAHPAGADGETAGTGRTGCRVHPAVAGRKPLLTEHAICRYQCAGRRVDTRTTHIRNPGRAGRASDRPACGKRLGSDRVLRRPVGEAAHEAARARRAGGSAGGVCRIGRALVRRAIRFAAGAPHGGAFCRSVPDTGLRAGDALHLAIAGNHGTRIRTLDHRLATAAEALGVSAALL